MTTTEHLLNANTVSFSNLISGDNIYQVPIFQRDYSWSEDNWDDLWLDIANSIESNSHHYMGSLVLMKKGAKNYQIIDGQQRITTLSLLALACIKVIDELIINDIQSDDNKERKDILLKRFIGYKSASSLKFTSKLKLNEENNPFYSSYLVQLEEVVNDKKLSKTNKLLKKAFDFFYAKIREEIYKQDSAVELVDFLEYVGDNLTFIEITVVDELNAYLVFETLNDRGLDLSVTDLLKNFLFSQVASKEDQEHLKNKWNNILRFIKYKDFSYFLRYYWISRNKLVTEKELFKTIKKSISNAEDVFNLVSDLEIHAELFSALKDPNDDLWKGDKLIIEHISELDLFNHWLPIPLLLVSHEKFDQNDFAKICKICSYIAFRYSVIGGLKTNVLERVYNTAATNLFRGKTKHVSGVFNDLSNIYPSDDSFHTSFTQAYLNTKRKSKLVRYILYKIENHISGNSYDFLNDNGTIEHILPENPNIEWDKNFMKDIQTDFIYRIGNYTLLEPKKNRNCENKSIHEKREIYKTSKYKLSQEFTYDEWKPEKVKHRQAKLAKYAKAIWRLNF